MPASETARPKRRDPDRNRQKLITAVLDLIAERGVPDTTVSRITERSGLSRGMIHLHFKGKDGLLIAAAQDFSEAYSKQVDAYLSEAGPEPADVIRAAIRADLSPDILTPRTARIWHGFRGIANPDPEIADCCGTRGGVIKEVISAAFQELAALDGAADPGQLAEDASHGTIVLIEGMCADYLANLTTFSRSDAERVILRFLAGLFPRHFSV